MFSGRYNLLNTKNTTDQYRFIDILTWHRKGLLKNGVSFVCQWLLDDRVITSFNVYVYQNEIVIQYYVIRENEIVDEKKHIIGLNYTPCHYGGYRTWFCCPCENCNRRVAILYLKDGFSCRQCAELVYRSQREIELELVKRRISKIKKRLKSKNPRALISYVTKPKGMHMKTYWPLFIQSFRLDGELIDCLVEASHFTNPFKILRP